MEMGTGMVVEVPGLGTALVAPMGPTPAPATGTVTSTGQG